MTDRDRSVEDRLASSQEEIHELTQEMLNLYRQVNLLYRIGDLIADCSEAEEVCRLILREAVKIVRARSGLMQLEDGTEVGRAPAEPRSKLEVPVSTRHGRLGWVRLYDKRQGFFTAADEKLVRAVARQAGIALENNALIQGLRANNEALNQANEELKQLDQMKSEFVSNVSHELRTPLASIKGFAATILDDPEMPPEVLQEFVTIINDILDVSKIMSGQMKYNLRPCALGQVAGDVVRLLSVLAREKGLELALDVVDDPTVEVDPDRMAQVLKNLVGNAIKFTDEGSVRLTVWSSGGDAHISVADTGVGISEEDRQQIFERFYRVENIVHTREGTGLGLALVRRILERFDGRIDVESVLGAGSTFTVSLPLDRIAGEPTVEGAPLEQSPTESGAG
jgi:signal transduction histidine kinase